MYLSREEEFSKMLNLLNGVEDNIIKIKKLIKYDNNYNINESDNKTMKLIESINLQIKKNKESINELKFPFLLFIVGSGNYGKSTLTNTLLNQEIVKTTDLPNTWKLDLFIKSEVERLHITYEDESTVVKNLKEGNKLLEKEEYKFKESKRKVARMVNEYKSLNNREVNSLKKYKKEQEEKYLYKSKIMQIKYFIKKCGILDEFIIVDTPGLNQNLIKDTLNRMKSYYIKADGVIWLVDAQNLVSRESNKLIEEIKEIDDLGREEKNKILVINKMDIIKKTDPNNIYKVKKRAYELYENKFKDIVFISAREGLEGIIKKDYSLIKTSNINTLLESIDENFAKLAKEKQISSKYKNIDIMKKNIIKEMNTYKRCLYKDISTYNEVEFELKEKTKNLRTYVLTYLESLKNKYYSNNDDLDNLNKSIVELEKVCSLKLEQIYNSLYLRCNLNKECNIKKLNTKIYFSKSKYLIFDTNNFDILYKSNNKNTNQMENILNKLTLKNLNNQSYDELLIKNIVSQKINNLSKEIIIILDEKLEIIKKNINEIKEKNFENTYLDYSKVKVHIEFLNNIESIFIKLR